MGHRGAGLAEDRRALLPDLPDGQGGLVERAAELEQRDRHQHHQQHQAPAAISPAISPTDTRVPFSGVVGCCPRDVPAGAHSSRGPRRPLGLAHWQPSAVTPHDRPQLGQPFPDAGLGAAAGGPVVVAAATSGVGRVLLRDDALGMVVGYP